VKPKKGAKKAKPEPKSDGEEDVKPKKGGKKAKAEPKSDEEEEVTPKKGGRKSKTLVEDDGEEEDVKPAVKKAKAAPKKVSGCCIYL
jgi:hypothetical protein